MCICQWFPTFLEVLNPTSSLHAFIEPFPNFLTTFFLEKLPKIFDDVLLFRKAPKNFLLTPSPRPMTVEPLKLTHRTPGVRSNPGWEPLVYAYDTVTEKVTELYRIHFSEKEGMLYRIHFSRKERELYRILFFV